MTAAKEWQLRIEQAEAIAKLVREFVGDVEALDRLVGSVQATDALVAGRRFVGTLDVLVDQLRIGAIEDQ